MDLNQITWLLPLVAIVVLSIVIKIGGSRTSTRTRVIGLVVAGAIMAIAVLWRRLHGGF